MLARALAVVFVAVAAAAVAWLRPGGIAWTPESLHAWIAQWPHAPLVFIAVLVLRPFLFIPSALLMAAGGALFGVVPGTLLGTVGGAISGVMIFWLARSLGREAVERRFGPRLRMADAYLRDRGVTMVAAYTAFPATPLGIAQAACGLSSMRALHFALATALGVLPRTALLAWFGSSLAQAQWLRAATALLLIAAAIAVGWRMRSRGVVG